jgi:hypothetical protein
MKDLNSSRISRTPAAVSADRLAVTGGFEKCGSILRLAALGAALACAGAASAATTRIADGVAYHCAQEATLVLHCEYRFIEPALATGISAQAGRVALPVSGERTFPGAGDTVAVLFLVDTSDPARAGVIARNIEQLGRLADATKGHYRLGLGRFDSDLEIVAPLGSAPEAIKSAAGDLAAVGKTTELYRSLLEAVRAISTFDADRRALYVFSDGLAEDRAYGHEDVVEAALAADVAIFTMGFPRSVSLSVALQSLRRLSEDSGGRFVAASGDDSRLPEEFLDDPYRALDGGGAFAIDLAAAVEAGAAGETQAEVRVQTAGAERRLPITLELPGAEPAPIVVQAPAAGEAQVARPPSPAPAPAPAGAFATVNLWLWYGVPAAFLLVVVVALVLYGRIWRQGARHGVTAAASEHKPFAYLVREDDESVRHMITQSPWRIGRSRNNDLTLDDHSVSRQHAEIHRKADGSFTVTDLDSLNGVFVNDKKVETSELHEGDDVDIGDVNFRFTLYDNDYAAQEPTVMIHTRTP